MNQLPPGVKRENISYRLAYDAHRNMSHVPDTRAKQEQDSYLQLMQSDYESLKGCVQNEAEQALLDEEFARYAVAFAHKKSIVLLADSRTASAMICGPANFPVERNRKRMATAMKRSEEMLEFRKRALAAIRKKIRPELSIIASADPNAVESLQAKLDGLRKEHEQAKKANALIRKHKGQSSVIPALVELGYDEKAAARLLQPDFCGRIGHPDYEMVNRNANMKRVEQRIKEVSSMKASEAKEIKYAGDITLEECPDDARIRLRFPGKPERVVIEKLKRAGWRWSPTNVAWQRHLNNAGRYSAIELLNALGIQKEEQNATVQS